MTKAGDVAGFYDRIADGYDVLTAGDAEEVAVILSLAGYGPGNALDVGTGTGRIAIPLALRGWFVVGVDVSRRMLQRVAEAASRAGVADSLVCCQAEAADDRAMPEGPFQLVVAIGCLFHIPDMACVRAAVAAMAKRLAPGGLLLVDTETDGSGGWGEDGERLLGAYETAGGNRVAITVRNAVNRAEHRQDATFVLTSVDPCGRTLERDVVHQSSMWMPAAHLCRLLEDAGLTVVETREGWAGRRAPNALVIARRCA